MFKSVAIIGHENAGKSYLVANFIGKKFVNEPTIGMQIHDFTYKNTKLTICDISGKGGKEGFYRNMIPSMLTRSNAVVICVSCEENSFQDKVELYLRTVPQVLINNKVPIFLVLTKVNKIENNKETKIELCKNIAEQLNLNFCLVDHNKESTDELFTEVINKMSELNDNSIKFSNCLDGLSNRLENIKSNSNQSINDKKIINSATVVVESARELLANLTTNNSNRTDLSNDYSANINKVFAKEMGVLKQDPHFYFLMLDVVSLLSGVGIFLQIYSFCKNGTFGFFSNINKLDDSKDEDIEMVEIKNENETVSKVY